ncbi:MAG: membrane protein [Candidatus Hinthialibacteria bacterium]|nr:anion transporter [bacterium]MBV6481465.1 putative transporter [bacterium]MCE7909178.1 anion transporter [Candidatus Omnitrophica bacterium COP1]
MDTTVLIIFILVYLGMMLGRYPGLALDRTGIALLGAITLLALGKTTPEDARDSIDVPTMALLLGLMVVSAQFRLGGFYTQVTRVLAQIDVSPSLLLGLMILISGFLSALLANDIICLAMTPVMIEGIEKRKLNPLPYLLGLACASNVGSAATLIGNPQNMLIGQKLGLSFSGYLIEALPPVMIGLGIIWGVIHIQTRGNWTSDQPVQVASAPAFNLWQTSKAIVVLFFLILAFLFSNWPREVVALCAAGLLLTSRRMTTRSILSLVDWNLLTLFAGLFIVNHVLDISGVLKELMGWLKEMRIHLEQPMWLFGTTVVLSNLVSNVPATILLLPAATHEMAGPILALSSTLAGNLFIVGSIANIIVVEQAGLMGVRISWVDHAKTGLPVTLLTLAVSALWLWLRSGG